MTKPGYLDIRTCVKCLGTERDKSGACASCGSRSWKVIKKRIAKAKVVADGG